MGGINHENTLDNGVCAWEALTDKGYNLKHVTSHLKGAFSPICLKFNANNKCNKTSHSTVTGNEGCIIPVANGNRKDKLKIVKRP